jgi:putative salt-induced outer membrane protein YdiY
MLPPAVLLCLLTLLAAAPAIADEVVFTNGDRLTGTILRAEGGSMVIKSDLVGEVTVKMEHVKTFSTSAPAEVHLTDGTVLKQQVAEGGDGEIVTKEGGAVTAQTVKLADVKAVNPPWGTWTGRIGAGGVITRGNSNTWTLNATADAQRRTENDRLTLGGQYLYARQNKDDGAGKATTSANAWLARGQYDYFLTQKLYGFGSLSAEGDEIARLDLRLVPSAGLGYQWVESETLNFNTEGGLALVYEDFEEEDSTEHLAARLAYHFDWAPTSAVNLFHNLVYLPSLEDAGDFNTYTDAGIRVSLVASMFTELKFEWRHDQTPADDTKRNDYRYLMTVGWEFD